MTNLYLIDSTDIAAMQREVRKLEDRLASTTSRAVRSEIRAAIKGWEARIEFQHDEAMARISAGNVAADPVYNPLAAQL